MNDLYPLLGPNIISHLEACQKAERSTFNYFSTKSSFIKAIEDHIVNSKDCVLIDREGRDVSCHRGTGYAIGCKNVIVHFHVPPETQMMSFDIEVGFCPLEDDPEYNGYDGGSDIVRKVRLFAQTDLELNFTKVKFKKWLDDQRQTKEKEEWKNTFEPLKHIIEKYPKRIKELLK